MPSRSIARTVAPVRAFNAWNRRRARSRGRLRIAIHPRDLRLALREGQTPDGPLDTRTMPVRVTQHFSDHEIDALWAYLQTVEPRPFGER